MHTQELVSAWREMGHDVTVLRHGRPEGEEARVASRSRTYPAWLSYWLHEPRQILENAAYWPERRWMRAARPDCVVMRYEYGRIAGGLAARSAGLPWILQVDGPYGLEAKRLNYWKLPGVCSAAERWLIRSCPAFFVVSSQIFDYYRAQGVPAGKMLVVPNGVNPTRFNPGLSGQAVRRRYGLESYQVLGFAGGFYPWHGVEGLLHLMETVIPQHPGLALLLVGEGSERSRLERAAGKRGLGRRVVFTGPVRMEEVPEHVAAMDIALAPYSPQAQGTLYGSPLKLFEYMAGGKPVVTAALGQITEVIRHGENGLLFQSGDWPGFAAQVNRFIEDGSLRERCGRQARQTVEQGYTWRHAATRIARLAERAMQGAPNPAAGI